MNPMYQATAAAAAKPFDQAVMANAVRQFNQVTQGLTKLTMAPPVSALPFSPFTEFALGGEMVTTVDEAIATDVESQCVIGLHANLEAPIANLKNPLTKKCAVSFKAAGPRPTLRIKEPDGPTSAVGKVYRFGGKLELHNLVISEFKDYRVYANIKAREGELGYLEGDGFVYAKVSGADLQKAGGIIDNLPVCDHSLSEDDAASLRVSGTTLLPEEFDKQHIDVGETHKLVPIASFVYRKYCHSFAALQPLKEASHLVLMDKATFAALEPGAKKAMDWFTPIVAKNLEITIVPEPRYDEKGVPVEDSFRSHMRRPAKNAAAAQAEKINISFAGSYTCHTYKCDDQGTTGAKQ